MVSKEYFRDYYRRNRARYLAKAKKWKKDNPEARKQHVRAHSAVRRARKTTPEGRAIELWRAASKRGYEFTITKEFVTDLVRKATTCPYTGVPFDFTLLAKGVRNPWAPSLDRVDNAKGYTPDNVEIVSTWYNVAKSDWAPRDMARAFQAIVQMQKGAACG
jgi:hypothetical protein